MPQRPHTDDLQGVTQTETLAAALSVCWIVGMGLFFWFLPAESGGLRHVVMLLAMGVPVGMAWIALVSARAARRMVAQTQSMQGALDGLRQALIDSRPAPAVPVAEPAPDAAASHFASRREMSRQIAPRAPAHRQADQPALALEPGPEDDDPPLQRPDLVRALNFPENQDDTDGFAALRRALRDRQARRLVQASQDVLTLLSQDGIYMDDLRPDPASADLWRRFATGERGRGIDGLGAVRDAATLAVVAARMREDTIFRDAVHHFMRRFDEILVIFAQDATDTDLLALAETRTARAFMLLGRATRTFDQAMWDIFLKTLPFFMLIALGYGSGRTKFFSAEATAYLTKFVFYFALSAMLFRFSANLSLDAILDWHFVFAYLAGTSVVYVLATLVALRRNRPMTEAAVEAQCAVIGNVGFLGIPMLVLLLGEPAIGPIMLVLAVDLIVFGSLIVILITGSRDGRMSPVILVTVFTGLIKNPMIVSITLGLTVSSLGWTVPVPVNEFMVLLGAAATPGALFAIGASLATKSAERVAVAGWLTFCKLVLHPAAVAIAALLVFTLDPYAAGVMIAAAALPVAGNVFILAQHYRVAPSRVSASILLSTAASVVTVSLVIGWVTGFMGQDEQMKTLSQNRCFGGTQGVYSHASDACGVDMTFGLFLPEEAAIGPVPVLWFLSGLTCTHENAMIKAGMQGWAAEQGIAVVFPDTSPRGEGVANDDAFDLGQGAGFYVNATQAPWAPHFRMWDYISRELPALIGANFALDMDRQAITGHSMGGHGALTLAMGLPGRFRSVSAFAPICHPTQSDWGRKQFTAYLGADEGAWAAHDATLLMKDRGFDGPVLIDTGTADQFGDLLGTEHLAAAIAARRQDGVLRLQKGYDHSYFFIATFMEDHVDFHAQALYA